MGQQVIVLIVIAAAVAWLAWYGYRFWSPKKGGCAGGCCSGTDKAERPAAKASTQFLPADDLVARLKARH